MKFQAFPPALIFFVDELAPGTGGEARGPIVRIRKKYLTDEGILKHELEHVKQYWTGVALGVAVVALLMASGLLSRYLSPNAWSLLISVTIALPSLAYLLIAPYRLWAELKAYAVQVGYATDKEAATVLFGSFIADSYRLSITKDAAAARLRNMV